MSNEDDAHANGMQVCPACGDWLPLDMWTFRCLGKGRHVKTTPYEAESPPPQRESLLETIILIWVIVIALLVALFVFGGLISSHDRSERSPAVGRSGDPS